MKRAVAARLMSNASSGDGRPIVPALEEFLLHGVRYAYPPERGELARGMPTGYAAPPLNAVIGARRAAAGVAVCRGERARLQPSASIPIRAAVANSSSQEDAPRRKL